MPAAACPHLPACPGCPRFGAGDPAPAALARLRELCAHSGLPLEVKVGARRGFRHRARLAVRGRSAAPKIGVFSAGSHRVVDIPSCRVHHPLINQVMAALKAAMRDAGATCYSDTAHKGLVRGLQVAVERSSQTAQVVLICNDAQPDSAQALLERLSALLASQLHSLFWNGNPEVTNRILGDRFEHWSGPEAIVELLGGARVHFPPAAFGQNNLELFEELIGAIHASVSRGSRVVELYAGAGAIGLGLLRRDCSVIFNELSPDSLRGLERGLAELEPGERDRAAIIAGPAQAAAAAIQRDSIVIVDPPRKGLDPELTAALEQRSPAELVYVSCGLDAFLRDARLLSNQGFCLDALSVYDLFPYTEHVETLAHFKRR